MRSTPIRSPATNQHYGIRRHPKDGAVSINSRIFEMIDYNQQILFEVAMERVADMISTMIEEGSHPALIYVAMMSCISEVTTADGLWGQSPPDIFDIRGFWSLMHLLQEKAFGDPADDKSAPSRTAII